MRTVADRFAEALASVWVKRIYRIVGDNLNGINDAIRRQRYEEKRTQQLPNRARITTISRPIFTEDREGL